MPACRHVYLFDRQTRAMELISVSSDGAPGNSASQGGSVSADGRWVVFSSYANNLASTGEFNCWNRGYAAEGFCQQVYLRDCEQGKTYLVSRGWGGQLPDGFSSDLALTPDGRYVAFWSQATNIVPGVSIDHSYNGTIYLADLRDLLGTQP